MRRWPHGETCRWEPQDDEGAKDLNEPQMLGRPEQILPHGLRRTHPADSLILDLQPPELQGNAFLCQQPRLWPFSYSGHGTDPPPAEGGLCVQDRAALPGFLHWRGGWGQVRAAQGVRRARRSGRSGQPFWLGSLPFPRDRRSSVVLEGRTPWREVSSPELMGSAFRTLFSDPLVLPGHCVCPEGPAQANSAQEPAGDGAAMTHSHPTICLVYRWWHCPLNGQVLGLHACEDAVRGASFREGVWLPHQLSHQG